LLQVFNYLAGSLSRIFTTLQEVDDKLILYGFIAGFALNLVLAIQMVYYWNAPAAKAPAKVGGKQKVPAAIAEKQPVSGQSYAKVAAASPKQGKGKSPSTRRRG
jgi:mannose-P-dolichol utilization defect protein 1